MIQKQWVDGSEEREELFVIIKNRSAFSYFENVFFLWMNLKQRFIVEIMKKELI